MPKKSKLVKRELTSAERSRRDAGLRWAEANKESIVARGRELLRREKEQRAALRQAFSALKAERERQGLSLSDLERRTGISKPALSRLENAEELNATVSTICRVAQALGKAVDIVLVNQPGATP